MLERQQPTQHPAFVHTHNGVCKDEYYSYQNYLLTFFLNPTYGTSFQMKFAVLELPGCTWIFRLLNEVVREWATYSCPWLKTFSGRYIPTFSSVCHWASLIVIQKANSIGNCLLLNENGKVESAGDRSTGPLLGVIPFDRTPPQLLFPNPVHSCTCFSQLVVSHSAVQAPHSYYVAT